MLDFIIDKENCTGCTACFNACPVNCISMIDDEEGFKYPHSSEDCIECGKCKKVCPVLNKAEEKSLEYKNQHCVAAISKNNEVWLNSTSGGAFTEICNTYGDSETVIFGAKFNGLNIIHSYVVGVENLYEFRKSKYIQSDLGNSFSEVRRFLKENKKVIFSGTPCQIAGLKSYLNKEYLNLLCIDLICHGVGSQKVFNDCLADLSKTYCSEIIKYDFRYKDRKRNKHFDYTTQYHLKSGKKSILELDNYNKLFLSQLCIRPSCQERCIYRNKNRLSDITIADFKGKPRIFPLDKDSRNYSTIVINSKKGENVFENLHNRMKMLECEMKDIEKYNPLFFKHTQDNQDRDSFFKDYINGKSIDELVSKYTKKEKKTLLNKVKRVMPYSVKLLIIRMLNK